MNILITGGAGSLGRAFTKFLQSQFGGAGLQNPHRITIVDNNEWAVAEAQHLFPTVRYVLADFKDYPLVGNEDVIIHAAAYKHVDLAQKNPRQTIINNLNKTIKFYEQCEHTLAKVLYISTDKAVEPISVYGATKMLAEALTFEIGGQVARLGNIIASSGSVIPTWEAQIAAKQPITITNERMTRYMIEAEDAVNQIWNEFVKGERLIIPIMEQPRRLLDILTEVLERHGYDSPEAYEPGVVRIGMRSGEKLHEKLKWDHE